MALIKLGRSDGFVCSQIKFSSFIYAGAIALWLIKKEKIVGRNLASVI